jgi:hypothetical protein
VEDGKKIGKKLVITKGIKNRKSDDLRLIGM